MTIIFTTNVFLVRKYLFAPLSKLEYSAQQISAGDLNAQIDTNSDDEIGELARTFSQMMKSIKTISASRDELNQEIAERKRIELDLRNSEEKLRNIFENSTNMFYSHSPEHIITYLSPQVNEILGYTQEEAMINWTKLASENPINEIGFEITLKAIETGARQPPYELELIKKNGEHIYVEVREAPIVKNGKTISIVGAMIDITERVNAEEEKQNLEVHLRQQQKLESIGTLASGVAHEINNPITGIMNYAQLIHDRIDSSEIQLRKFSAGIIEETRRVAVIVSNLLAFSRQDTKHHSVARISDIINDTLSLIRAVCRRDQITLNVNLPDDLPQIRCRSQQIQQVLMNLLTNARDALNEKYPEHDPDKIINISVHTFEKEEQRWLRVVIENHGSYIPAELRNRIFDPFFTTKDRTLGTGLGLSVSLRIVQDHHGELTLESGKNQPTRFYLDLPVKNDWELS